MKWANIFIIAYKNILKNKMRSFLTSLGIIIGVCSVIIMVAIGQGTQKKVQDQISSLGSNLLIISQKANRAGGISRGAGSQNKITLADFEKIKKEAKNVQYVSPLIPSFSQVISKWNNWNTTIYGVSLDYFDIKSLTLASGEIFKDQDSHAKKKLAILGKTVADQLFPDIDPIGETIRIGNVPFKIVGVLNAKGKSAFGTDQDDIILAPYETVLTRLSGGKYIRTIFASAFSSDSMSTAQEEIRALVREQHKLKENEDDDFSIGNQAEIAQTAEETTRMFTLLLGSIAGVSLLVGGIGIMNIMLVSVTERTREIGIRMAVGARSSDVLTQFLVEAIVLSLTGGIIGTLMALLIAILLNAFSPVQAVINPTIIFMSFVFSGSVGVFFGFYPAKKASDLNPIDALRYE